MAKPLVTYTGLPEATIRKAGPALVRLIHTWEAMVHQSKSARYNVQGSPYADAVNAVCSGLEDKLHGFTDPLVARAQVLGVPVPYNLALVAKNSGLQPFPDDLDDGAKIMELLATTWADVCTISREQVQALRDAGDMVSAHVAEHQVMLLEAASSVFQDIMGAGDPAEALEAIGTEAHETTPAKG